MNLHNPNQKEHTMEIVGLILITIGAIIALIYGIQLIILAFKTSIPWGLGYIFVPFVSLIFIIMHWEDAKRPFLKGLICIPFYLIGFMMAGTNAINNAPNTNPFNNNLTPPSSITIPE